MSRPPLRIAIVGAGFAGLCMAIRLKQSGYSHFTVYEQAAEVGGTWRDNRYPGLACDIESHLYCYSFEPKPDWSRRYAPQAEILAYLKHCVLRHGLDAHLRLSCGVTDASFDDDTLSWRLSLAGGTMETADLVVAAGGVFGKPAWPDIPGLRDFGGHLLHTARWDAAWNAAGRRIAVIGTGASAVQLVPELARQAAALSVFQRTPAWVLPRRDRAFTPDEHRRWRSSPWRQALRRAGIYWKQEGLAIGLLHPSLRKPVEWRARAHLLRQVRDPALRQRLTPRYALGCKRVLWSDDFYPALQAPHVRLVTEPIMAATASGLVTAGGVEHAVDAIVCATGYRVTDGPLPFTVHGRGGLSLYQAWAGGARAYLGSAVPGFPNFFLLVGPNSGLGHSSITLMIEAQVAQVLEAIGRLQGKRRIVEVRAEALDAYYRRLERRLAGSVWSSGCMSWYRNRAGRNTVIWPGLVTEFRLWAARLDSDAYEFS